MYRVFADVEVRGRGELPRNNFIVSVTSRPYPVVAEDELNVSFPMVAGTFIYMPSDHLGMAFSLDGGSLRTPLILYEIPHEDMDLTFDLDGGSLRSPLVKYVCSPELLDIAFALPTGSMRVALVSYKNWPAEELDVGFSLDGGSLT